MSANTITTSDGVVYTVESQSAEARALFALLVEWKEEFAAHQKKQVQLDSAIAYLSNQLEGMLR
jgi:hypothetical protein